MSEPREPTRIEDLYHRYKKAGGQRQQMKLAVTTDVIANAFETTIESVTRLRASGPFYPAGTRKALFDLYEERRERTKSILDTEHMQALLWSPPRWSVEDRPELEFMFIAHEVSPASGVNGNKRVWAIEKEHRVSADLLLMNTTDRTPIVAEFKLGGDQNAEYGLVQALAAAAQLTPLSQRRRLRSQYSEHFGKHVPELLDVYVILADRRITGTRPDLLKRAFAHAGELTTSGRLDQWIRRIVFLEVKRAGDLTFTALSRV